MKLEKSTYIIFVICLILYVIFHLWYGGNSEPLTKAETDNYISMIKNNSTSNLHNTSYSNNNSVTVNKHIYMPDFMASKLVEEMLQSKLNT